MMHNDLILFGGFSVCSHVQENTSVCTVHFCAGGVCYDSVYLFPHIGNLEEDRTISSITEAILCLHLSELSIDALTFVPHSITICQVCIKIMNVLCTCWF
jgi:hypothetical protein